MYDIIQLDLIIKDFLHIDFVGEITSEFKEKTYIYSCYTWGIINILLFL